MTTKNQRADLQKKIAIAKQQPDRKRRYDAELKREITSYAQGRLENSVSVRLLAEDLGLERTTLSNWLRQARAQEQNEERIAAPSESRNERIATDGDEQ